MSLHIPGVYAMAVLDVAAERGLSPQVLLAQANMTIDPAELLDTGLRLAQHVQLMAIVEAALDDPALAVEVGWRLPPTALGSVGYAILASATMAEVLEVLQRFWHLMGRGSSISVDTRDPIGTIEVDVRLPMPEVAHTKVKEIILVSMYRGVLALAPEGADQCEAWFDVDEPSYAAAVRRRLPRARYAMPACQFRFPTEQLSTPLAMSNPMGLRTAMSWCEREERERGLSDGRLSARLGAQLKAGIGRFPSLDDMARRMAMAPRTLRRHLRAEGTSYSRLLEAARRREATRLLEQSDLPVREIATLLGYEEPANFTRAFRRWTGGPPSAHRRTHRQPWPKSRSSDGAQPEVVGRAPSEASRSKAGPSPG